MIYEKVGISATFPILNSSFSEKKFDEACHNYFWGKLS
jgi:hypothetical protein